MVVAERHLSVAALLANQSDWTSPPAFCLLREALLLFSRRRTLQNLEARSRTQVTIQKNCDFTVGLAGLG